MVCFRCIFLGKNPCQLLFNRLSIRFGFGTVRLSLTLLEGESVVNEQLV